MTTCETLLAIGRMCSFFLPIFLRSPFGQEFFNCSVILVGFRCETLPANTNDDLAVKVQIIERVWRIGFRAALLAPRSIFIQRCLLHRASRRILEADSLSQSVVR